MTAEVRVHHRPDRRRAVTAALLSLLGLLLLAGPIRAVAPGSVVVLPTTGIVDAVMADYVAGGLAIAADEGASAVVIRLDTPGGSLDATQRIVSSLLTSRVPTIVWVAPAGGHAASAGTLITLAANLAWMAPGTRIGAATPIDGSGADIPGALGDKVRNDTIAWVTSIALERGRPVDWAVATVTEARSSPATEAASVGAVDGVAGTIEDVLRDATGRTVRVGGSDVVLDLAGDPVEELGINPLQGFLHLLTDPNIAFLLFTLGFYGLLFELQSPNFVTGTIGAIAIVLAFIGFGSLPLNVGGLLLVGLGVILLGLEPSMPSHGLLTVGGVVCLLLGASALYSQPGPFEPDVGVAVPVLVVAAATGAAFAIAITTTAIRTRRMTAPSGTVPARVAIGTLGEVRRPLEPIGSIYAAGEEWSARTMDGSALARGTPVRVVASDGLVAVVEPAASG